MKRLLAAALAAYVLPVFAEEIKHVDSNAAMATAKAAIVLQLRDPESVRWREVIIDPIDGDVCIEVNAKNGFGGYTGFEPIFYNARLGEVEYGNTARADCKWLRIRPANLSPDQEKQRANLEKLAKEDASDTPEQMCSLVTAADGNWLFGIERKADARSYLKERLILVDACLDRFTVIGSNEPDLHKRLADRRESLMSGIRDPESYIGKKLR